MPRTWRMGRSIRSGVQHQGLGQDKQSAICAWDLGLIPHLISQVTDCRRRLNHSACCHLYYPAPRHVLKSRLTASAGRVDHPVSHPRCSNRIEVKRRRMGPSIRLDADRQVQRRPQDVVLRQHESPGRSPVPVDSVRLPRLALAWHVWLRDDRSLMLTAPPMTPRLPEGPMHHLPAHLRPATSTRPRRRNANKPTCHRTPITARTTRRTPVKAREGTARTLPHLSSSRRRAVLAAFSTSSRTAGAVVSKVTLVADTEEVTSSMAVMVEATPSRAGMADIPSRAVTAEEGR